MQVLEAEAGGWEQGKQPASPTEPARPPTPKITRLAVASMLIDGDASSLHVALRPGSVCGPSSQPGE